MNKRVIKILDEIKKNAPKELTDNLMHEVHQSPSIEFVVKKALTSKTISKDKKEKLKTLLDSGTISRKTMEANVDVEKQLDEYFDREIKKAIEEGRLPKPDHEKLKAKIKKITRKNEKRNNSRA